MTPVNIHDMTLAAGGILWRRSSHGREIAIIHRTRYGDEWCLPKGKQEKGEKLFNTALREVFEETGCDGEVTGFAGTTNYEHKDKPKIVLFWNMEIKKECSFKPSEEVDKVEWLKPKKAIKRLNHLEEKNLLTKVYYCQMRHPCFKLFRFFCSRRYERLAGTILAFRQELEHRICKTNSSDQTNRCWIDAARNLLKEAESQLGKKNIDKSWRCLQAAQRLELFGLNKDELKSKVVSLREEASKLNVWRKKATEKLLGVRDCEIADLENVYQATLLRDEHYSNQAYKGSLAKSHIMHLAIILASIFLLLFLLMGAENSPLGSSSNPSNLMMFVSVSLFGLLGGTISAMLKVQDTTKSSRIPEMVTTASLTLLRIFMGAASAMVIYVFLQSQLKGIFEFLKDITLEPYTIFAISFVAGFTERLVLRAVAYVAGK